MKWVNKWWIKIRFIGVIDEKTLRVFEMSHGFYTAISFVVLVPFFCVFSTRSNWKKECWTFSHSVNSNCDSGSATTPETLSSPLSPNCDSESRVIHQRNSSTSESRWELQRKFCVCVCCLSYKNRGERERVW
jgi:hypothetical protein